MSCCAGKQEMNELKQMKQTKELCQKDARASLGASYGQIQDD